MRRGNSTDIELQQNGYVCIKSFVRQKSSRLEAKNLYNFDRKFKINPLFKKEQQKDYGKNWAKIGINQMYKAFWPLTANFSDG